MNSLFTPEHHDESEIFRPLRQMRSPLSMNAVKNYIYERIGEISLWQRIQRLIFQTGSFTAIIATICCINSPAGETRGILIHQPVSSALVAISNNLDNRSASAALHTIDSKISAVILADEKVNEEKTIAIQEKQEILHPISSTVPIETPPSVIDSKTETISEIPFSKDNETSAWRPFTEIQGMGIADHTRMYGGGVSAGFIHDWQMFSAHFMDAGGIRDDRKDNPSLSNVSKIKGETGEQFALMFGGIFEHGRFSTSLQLGPSYSMSAITSGLKGIPTSNTILNQNTLGMSAQISAGYRFTDNLSANVEGLFGYRSAFSKGLMMSIMFQP